jgi:hypothetical protein
MYHKLSPEYNTIIYIHIVIKKNLYNMYENEHGVNTDLRYYWII